MITTPWILMELGVFLCVATVTGFIIPQILLIAFRKNLFDEVDVRKIHKGTVPRLGGIAFFPAILLSIFLLIGFSLEWGDEAVLAEISGGLQQLCFIVCSAVVLYLVGMSDDLIGVKYRAKFLVQIICAIFLYLGGVQLDNLHGLFGIHELGEAGSMAMTILIVVFITNAINLIDGIDGLASGLSAIACIFYAYVYYASGMHIYSALAMATLGALVPFFLYNVFGNVTKRTKIFMGDTGALTIGLILSVLAICICHMPDSADGQNTGVLAFAPLLIPGLDVVRVYLHRIKGRRSPFMPDKCHIHHKLLALGLRQRVAMPLILGASAALVLVNFLLSNIINITLLFFLDLAVWIIANMLLTRAIHRREKRLGEKIYD